MRLRSPARPLRVRSYAERRRSHVAWGVVALLAVLVGTYLAFGGPVPLGGGYEVRAVLRDANQLRSGSPVRIAGVDVGEVVDVGRGPGSTAVATLRIEKDGLPLHADATLKIRPRLFLEGNFFVDLRPGSPSADEIPDGGTIPLAQTATPVQLDQVLSALDADGREQLQVTLRELADAAGRGGGRGAGAPGSGADAFGRGLERAGPAFRAAAVTARAFRGTGERDLSETVAAVARVTGALDARREQLAGLVDGFDRAAGAVAAEDRALSATIRGLAATLGDAPPAIAAIRAAMPAARAFTADVRPLLRRAPRTLDLLRPLLAELRPLLADDALPALTSALRPPLRELAALQPGLEALLERVTPVADCVRDQALPVLTTPVQDGEHTTGRAPWQELASSLVGLSGASANFDGNGHAVRYLAGFGEHLVSTGRLPGGYALQGLVPLPFEGARPARPERRPPFRPDVPCATQEPVDLTARGIPAPPAQPAPRVSARDRRLLRDALRDLFAEAGR